MTGCARSIRLISAFEVCTEKHATRRSSCLRLGVSLKNMGAVRTYRLTKCVRRGRLVCKRGILLVHLQLHPQKVRQHTLNRVLRAPGCPPYHFASICSQKIKKALTAQIWAFYGCAISDPSVFLSQNAFPSERIAFQGLDACTSD